MKVSAKSHSAENHKESSMLAGFGLVKCLALILQRFLGNLKQ